jgi:hypothetical protein
MRLQIGDAHLVHDLIMVMSGHDVKYRHGVANEVPQLTFPGAKDLAIQGRDRGHSRISLFN